MGDVLAVATSADGKAWRALTMPPTIPSGEHALALAAPAGPDLVLAATTDDGTVLWSTPAPPSM